LTQAVGLDPNRYKSSTAEGGERSFVTLDSLLSDAARYRECDPFLVRCRSCEGTLAFAPMHDREASCMHPSGPACAACAAALGVPSMLVQLEVQVRAAIARYYEGWTVCDDPTCGQRTRAMSVYGRRCLRTGCRGTVAFEYGDGQLYNQLRYFRSLFDEERVRKAATGGSGQGACSGAGRAGCGTMLTRWGLQKSSGASLRRTTRYCGSLSPSWTSTWISPAGAGSNSTACSRS
jgi:DNA polymerase alpha subunit A